MWLPLAVGFALAAASLGGQLPGILSYELHPQKVYLDQAANPNITLTLNVTYVDSADSGVDLGKTEFVFTNGSAYFPVVDCTPNDRRGSAQGTGKRAWVQQNCTIPITRAYQAGHYQLYDMHLRSLNGDDIRTANTDLLNAVNRELESALCLPPYFTLTHAVKANTISITDIKFNFSIALVDYKEVILPIRMEFMSPNGLNLSTVAIVMQDTANSNSSVLRSLPCTLAQPIRPTDPQNMGPPDAPTMGTILCNLFVPKSATEGTYQLSNVLMEDIKGNHWNSERLSVFLTIDSDTAEHHMHSHVGEDGNFFHMHMCSIPQVTVVSEKVSCPASKLLSCMSSNYRCTNESNPPCPVSKTCQQKYKFARCAAGMYCYDALALWCNGGFFSGDKQPGCLNDLQSFCSRVQGNSKCDAQKFKDCTKAFDTAPKKADECAKKREYNTCAESSGCLSLRRDMSNCPGKIVIHRPPGVQRTTTVNSALVSEDDFLFDTFRNAPGVHGELERRYPSPAAAPRGPPTVFYVVGAVTGVAALAVALVARRRRSPGPQADGLLPEAL